MTKRIDINPLLDEIISETGLTQEEIAGKLNYEKTYISQARKAGTQKLYDKLVSFRNEFRKSQQYIAGSQPADWRDHQISLLTEQNRFLQQQLQFMQENLITIISQKMDTSLSETQEQARLNRAYLKTLAQMIQQHRSKMEGVPIKTFQKDMDTMLSTFGE